AQSENEEDGRRKIGTLDEIIAHAGDQRPAGGAAGFASRFAFGASRLNIFNIRSVMRKPPTMLEVAHTTATKPRIVATLFARDPAAMSEPTSEIPEIAFVAAINGVCSSGGTREITMYPVNAARTNTYSSRRSILFSLRRES